MTDDLDQLTTTKWETDLKRILDFLFLDLFAPAYLSKISDLPLTTNQFHILKILDNLGPLGVSMVADMLRISRAAASKNIDILVKFNLVRRQIKHTDRRKTFVSIMPGGHSIVADFNALSAQGQNEALKGFTTDQKHQMLKLLTKYVSQRMEHENDAELMCARCNDNPKSECVLGAHHIQCMFLVE